MRRWLDVLRHGLPGGASGIPEARRRLSLLPRGEARAVVDAWLGAWMDGALGPAEWGALTGDASADPKHTMHLVWDALYEDDLAPFEIERLADGSAVERWAWSPRWIQMSQDEDIMLFGQPEALLEIAADPRCPKRSFLIAIASHEARDQAHAFVTGHARSGADPWALAARLAPLARNAGALDVASYFDRLASYARRGKVDRDGALQRAMDLHRCAPPPPADVDVRVEGDGWRVGYRARSPLPFVPAFVVARKTGALGPG